MALFGADKLKLVGSINKKQKKEPGKARLSYTEN